MPAKRNAQGAGNIRKRPDGRWEARYTVGRDPGTGKQVRKSVYGATQGEVLKKLKQIDSELENGTFVEPSKLTVSAWADIWTAEYLTNVKDATVVSYKGHIKNHIKPKLGAVFLQKLHPHHVQTFYNDLLRGGMSPKTVRNIHGILHSALDRAIKLNYIKSNPTSVCTLPRVERKEMEILPDNLVGTFLQAIEGHRYEAIYFIDLFTGMRQGEILGLSWDCVDFEKGTILVKQQLLRGRTPGAPYKIGPCKNDKIRRIKAAESVMMKLKERKKQQTAHQLRAGGAWNNEWNLVFTNELGRYLTHGNVYDHYKQIVADLGAAKLRFHDMRHTYAVISIMSGDDIKTVQENLGHHTAAFTLDQYGHITDAMKEASANRMDIYITGVKSSKGSK